MKRVLLAGLIAVAILVTGTAAHADTIVKGDEAHVLSLMNGTRANLGRQHLSAHDYLTGMAERQAQRMADRGDIYHNPNLSGEISSSGMDWRKVGENVGMGPNVDLIEDAFLKSPHHYDNIVDPSYNLAGVGAIKADDGTMYVVQVFANVISHAAPAPAPAAAAPTVAPKPATPAPAPAVAAAPKPVPATPRPRPVVQRTADPNAVIGGFVTPLDLSVTARHSGFTAVGSFFRHVGSTVASWV
jgi:hypothetical protein